MSAIYQRARPVHWDEVVGQEHVKDVLRAALERGRVGHAYLFSGPRGVGKTTTARLIAMTANCERDGVKPCGECSSCMAVRSNSHPDVLEIDAASNNSVDDVRELREKVGLAAMRGGKKIYILDEAHMMSRAAFNALLKTLEEPPSHVIFVLATTEPEKILPTILSRCQHYRFRRLSETEIAGKLARICEGEGVRAEPDALALIGRLADGAMRDGESLLERMLAAGEDVTRPGVEAALGLPPSQRTLFMARALALGDVEPLLAGASELYREGYAARTVVDGLKTALREAIHAALGLGTGERIEGAELGRLLKLQAALDEQEARFARSADLLSLELALTHALLAGDAAVGATTSTSAASVPSDVGTRLAKIERELAALRSAPRVAPEPAVASADVPDFEPAARRAPPRSAPREAPTEAPRPQGSWADVLRQANVQLRAFLKPAQVSVEGASVLVSFDERSKFHAKQTLDKFEDVAAIVERVFGAVDFELVTPDGTKKKSARNSGGAARAAPSTFVTSAEAAPLPQIEPAPSTPSEPRATPARSTIAAPPSESLDDLPDFTPTRSRSAPRPSGPAVTVPSAAPPVSAPATATTPSAESAPWEASPAVTYDPEPLSQEPVWDDAPLEAPLGKAPLRETTWDALSEEVPPTPKVSTPRPAAPVNAREAARLNAAASVRAHPMFAEATRRFSGKVRDSGVLRKPKGAANQEEADEPSEGEA
ncbi:DNA polymerase III subunit gamma/tau [Deinococcus yavapaiensis]|uniref:DNA polymerase III subunit gamma/tau n=1 Tax=Deinococcus yavapaiensis KR-236 TaxID=694435 RepID=A0A318SAA4_9DEIO|nr:DNA polymerase III subunit gamma/tau [Deinococcus yavapaiensis]PYE55809.1 DNA polymerase III gamma subunit /DNA polymerase III tau subunit [Deinococcus yavapaiensis KR-236]